MRNLNTLLHQAFARLNGEARAWYFLQQIERRGGLTDADVAELTDFHPEDELDDVGKALIVCAHVMDRHMAWERPKVAARESYVEPRRWTVDRDWVLDRRREP